MSAPRNVSVLWDLDTYPPSQGLSGYQVMHNIRRISAPYGNLTFVKAYIPSSTTSSSKVTNLLKRELRLSGAQVVEADEVLVRSASPSSILMSDLFACGIDQAVQTVILISRDLSLSYGVSLLRNRRISLSLVVPTNGVHESLQVHATGVLDWDQEVMSSGQYTASPQSRSITSPFHPQEPSAAMPLSAPATTLTFSRRATSSTLTRQASVISATSSPHSPSPTQKHGTNISGGADSPTLLVGYASIPQPASLKAMNPVSESKDRGLYSRADTPTSPLILPLPSSQRRAEYDNGGNSHEEGVRKKGQRLEVPAVVIHHQLPGVLVEKSPLSEPFSRPSSRANPAGHVDSPLDHTAPLRVHHSPRGRRNSPYATVDVQGRGQDDSMSVITHITLTPTDPEYHADTTASGVRGNHDTTHGPFRTPEPVTYSPPRGDGPPVYEFPLKGPIKVFEESPRNSPCSTPRPQASDAPIRVASPAGSAIYQGGATTWPISSASTTAPRCGALSFQLNPPPSKARQGVAGAQEVTPPPLIPTLGHVVATSSAGSLGPSAPVFNPFMPRKTPAPSLTLLHPTRTVQEAIPPASAVTQPRIPTPVLPPRPPEGHSVDKGKEREPPKPPAVPLHPATSTATRNDPIIPSWFAPLVEHIQSISNGQNIAVPRSSVGVFHKKRESIFSHAGVKNFKEYIASAVQAGLIEEVGRDHLKLRRPT